MKKITMKQLKNMGIRPIEVARLCKVSQPSVYKWEYDKGLVPERFHKVITKEVTRRHKLATKFLR